MQITPAGADDARALAQVHASNWQAACKSFLPADELASLSAEQREAWWRQQIAGNGTQILIASDDSGVQGWICFGAARGPDDSPGEGEIWALQASSRAWSRGVCHMLWLRARDALIEQGMRSCSLRVPPQNRQAVRFLRTAGFIATPSSPTQLLRVGERLRPATRYVQVISRQRGARQEAANLAASEPAAAAAAVAADGPAIELAGLQLLRGGRAGLSGRTAIVLLRLRMNAEHLAQLESRLQHGLGQLASRLSWGLDSDESPQAGLLQPGSASTGFGAAFAALSVALQRCAGEPVWHARVLEQNEQALRVALPWHRESVLRDAIKLALQQAARPQPDGFAEATGRWLNAVRLDGLSPALLQFYAAARRREIPVSLQAGMLRLGWGRQAERIDGGISGRTSELASQAARSKRLTRELLRSAALPVLPAQRVRDAAQAREAAARLGWPVTVRSEQQDLLVVTGIASEALLAQAFDAASRLSPDAVVVEKRLEGERHRMLVVAGRLIATRADDAGQSAVARQIHPDNRALAERAARIVGLDIAEVELLCRDLSRSWRDGDAAILGVSARPDFGTRWNSDPERDLAGEVIDCLFDEHHWRIPTAAISAADCGDTALMLHRIWLAAGLNAGSATEQGLWIGSDRINRGDLSGQSGGSLLLADPAVEAAAIVMPLKVMLTSGHPCDRYGVAALLDLDPGPGLEVERERLAALAAELLERTVDAVVINADDAGCLALLGHGQAARRVLVAADASAAALEPHLAQGGEAVFTADHGDGRWIVLAKGRSDAPLMPLTDVAAGRLAPGSERDTLFAAALAWAQGIGPALIRHALASFSQP